MAYVPVPKDLSKVKTKVAFNLTKRQIVCFAVALLLGLPLFFLLKDSTGTSLASMAMIAVMLPCFLFAIEDVVKQALSYSQRHNRKVVFAYLLLPGINDRSSDIRQLAKWFKGKNVMINVLQYNPTSNSKIRAPQKQEMVAFKHQLEQTGLEVTMRVSHGREIKAACGQLANTYNKAKKQQK